MAGSHRTNILEHVNVYYMCACHFLTHSSVDSHLGCFSISGIVNTTAVNIGCIELSKLVFSFSVGNYAVVELLDHMATVFLFF